MKKKKILIFSAVFILLVIITYQLRGKKEIKEQVRYVPVEAVSVDMKELIDTTGEVSALNRVEIKPSVSGRVDTLLVNEGDVVKKGQVLAYLSSSDRVAILDAVRANEKENLADWESSYKPTPVISPMNGKIILRNVVEGQTIATSDILFALADELIIVASVDEADIGKLRVGQTAVVTLDAYKDVTVKGTVFQILEEGKNVSNVITYYVKIRLDETPEFFKSLMTANIDITVKELKDAVAVPWNAIVENKDGKTCVLVNNGQGNTEKEIVTGITDGDYIQVVSGLKAGDIILVKVSAYQVQSDVAAAKGFLQMTPQKRKSNKDILSNSSKPADKK